MMATLTSLLLRAEVPHEGHSQQGGSNARAQGDARNRSSGQAIGYCVEIRSRDPKGRG